MEMLKLGGGILKQRKNELLLHQVPPEAPGGPL